MLIMFHESWSPKEKEKTLTYWLKFDIFKMGECFWCHSLLFVKYVKYGWRLGWYDFFQLWYKMLYHKTFFRKFWSQNCAKPESRMEICYFPGTTITIMTTSPKSCSFAHWRRPFLSHSLSFFDQLSQNNAVKNTSLANK